MKIDDKNFLYPRISVVIPSLNQGIFIEDAIRSVLLQSYPNTELIIIDGGSNDQTINILNKYNFWINYWVSEKDCGQSHAINKGISKSTGSIIFWLNADDQCLPGAFLKIAHIFSSLQNIKLAIGQAKVIDQQGNIIGEKRSAFTSWEEMVLQPENSIRQVATFFSRKLFEELGLLNIQLNIAMDTELLIRFTKLYKPYITQDYLSVFRVHPDAKTQQSILSLYYEADKVREYYIKKYLEKSILINYHKNMCARWIYFSKKTEFSVSDRLILLATAFKVAPMYFISRCIRALINNISLLIQKFK